VNKELVKKIVELNDDVSHATIPYWKKVHIDVIGNLTTLAISDTSIMSVLSLMQLTLMDFWREKWVLRLYLI